MILSPLIFRRAPQFFFDTLFLIIKILRNQKKSFVEQFVVGLLFGLTLVQLPFSNICEAQESNFDFIARYYDDSETQVISPHVNAKASILNDDVTVGAGYAMDIVTSSSADVRSWASQGKISDTRREVSGSLGANLEGGALTVGVVVSDENDYHSQTYSIGGSRDFFDKNTTVDLGLSMGNDHVQSSSDKGFDQVMKTGSMSVGITQVLNKISLMQILYEYTIQSGYLASPYRAARIGQTDGSVIAISENVPNLRAKQDVTLKYIYYALGSSMATSTAVRLYWDNWGVRSITLEPQLTRDFSKDFSMSLDFRYYRQTQSSFYKDKYDQTSLSPFLTGNKTLSEYWTGLVGIRPVLKLSYGWEIYGRVEYYMLKYTNFTDIGVPSNPNDDKLYGLTAQVFSLGILRNF